MMTSWSSDRKSAELLEEAIDIFLMDNDDDQEFEIISCQYQIYTIEKEIHHCALIIYKSLGNE